MILNKKINVISVIDGKFYLRNDLGEILELFRITMSREKDVLLTIYIWDYTDKSIV